MDERDRATGNLVEEPKMEIVERVRIEDALRQSEQRYRELFHQAPIATTEQDRSEAKQYLNGLRDSGVTDLRDYFRKNPEEAYRVFAMTKLLAINRAGMDFMGARTPEDLQARFIEMTEAMGFEVVLEQVLEMDAGIGHGQKEMDVQTLDGGVRHALVSWHVMEGHEQTLDRVWVSAIDITSLKEAQAAQLESEKRFHQLFNEAPIEILEQDRSEMKKHIDRLRESGVRDFKAYFDEHPEEVLRVACMGKVLAVNKAAIEAMGLETPEEFTAKYHLLAASMNFEDLKEQMVSLESGLPIKAHQETVLTTPAGQNRHVLMTWSVLKGHEDTFSRVWVSVQDITDRKRAEIALRESEERFRTIFEAAQDFMFIKDTELRYTNVNPAMLSLLEIVPDQIVGKTDEEIFPADWTKRMKSLEERVIEGQEVEIEQNLLWIAQPLTYNFVRFPMRDAAGQIVGLCGIGRDVTQRRDAGAPVSIAPRSPGSKVMKHTLDLVRRAAKTDSVVLFTGESGSGKDYLAEYLHRHSGRASSPYFAVNCAAVAPALAESELFGHEAGAFTGAQARKRGLLELAEGGTLLLNEVGELSPELQVKLLAFFDTQMFTRVGGEKNIRVNTRIVAATNRNLGKDIESGRFRQDLFYRLNVFVLEVPPLRERMEDLPSLVKELLPLLAHRMQVPEVPAVDPEVMATLARYNWPGNVRELRNILERALILCDKKRITTVDLSLQADIGVSPHGQGELSVTVRVPRGGSMNDILEHTKRLLVADGLKRSQGSIKEAARYRGVTRASLVHHMRSLGIRRDDA